MANVIQDQFFLSKHAGINITESEYLPDFEREAYITLAVNEIKSENESMKKALGA